MPSVCHITLYSKKTELFLDVIAYSYKTEKNFENCSINQTSRLRDTTDHIRTYN